MKLRMMRTKVCQHSYNTPYRRVRLNHVGGDSDDSTPKKKKGKVAAGMFSIHCVRVDN